LFLVLPQSDRHNDINLLGVRTEESRTR
jgi:hypothetical protein